MARRGLMRSKSGTAPTCNRPELALHSEAALLLLDGRLQRGAVLGELILRPHLRILGLVPVLALIRSRRACRNRRSSEAYSKRRSENISHSYSPLLLFQRDPTPRNV